MKHFARILAASTLTIAIAVMFAISLAAAPARAEVQPSLQLGTAQEFPSDLDSFETGVGHRADIFLWYQSISESLDTATLGPIAQGGRTIQIAWEPWDYGAPDLVNQPAYQLRDITAGNWDADIHRWARECKAFGYPVILRPMSEMNGDWTSWSGTVNGNVPSDYVPAWRHVHDIFVQEGATNVKFDWSPNVEGDGSTVTPVNTFNTYYPGDAYVDYVGLDGYNWGTMYNTPEWTSFWQSFTEIFQYSYDAFAARTNKPILISETASTELGGNKAQWITDAFASLPTRFPRIVGLTWFNYNKETDWRVTSSPASLAAFKAAVSVAPAPGPVVDSVAPVVNITAPVSGAVLTRGTVSVRADASDDVGVSRVEMYLGDRLLGSKQAAPYDFSFSTVGLQRGTYTLTAKAFDAAGNVSQSEIQVTIGASIKPSLRLKRNFSYWASYADFSARKLSASFTLQNVEGDTAVNAQITGAPATDGASETTPLPLGLGNLATGASGNFTLAFSIPAGVTRFSTSVRVAAEDEEGGSNVYP